MKDYFQRLLSKSVKFQPMSKETLKEKCLLFKRNPLLITTVLTLTLEKSQAADRTWHTHHSTNIV